MPETQQLLIDVPACESPTAVRRRLRAAEIKSLHGIKTHHAPHMEREVRWIAVEVPPRRLDDGGEIEGMSVADMFAWFGRLLDEGGWVGYGATEYEAVCDCCRNRKIEITE